MLTCKARLCHMTVELQAESNTQIDHSNLTCCRQLKVLCSTRWNHRVYTTRKYRAPIITTGKNAKAKTHIRV